VRSVLIHSATPLTYGWFILRVQVNQGSFADAIPLIVHQLATEQQILPKYHHSRLRMARLLLHCTRETEKPFYSGEAKQHGVEVPSTEGQVPDSWLFPFSSNIGKPIFDLDVDSIINWNEFDELSLRYC
jgi:hypothetical protein